MELIDAITSKENLNKAYKKVVANKGAGGVDGMKVEELGAYIKENQDEIIQSIRNRTYKPKPVRRVYIPKDNGKQRPLGIPTVLDRVIQQAIAQPIIRTGIRASGCITAIWSFCGNLITKIQDTSHMVMILTGMERMKFSAAII